MSKPKNVSVSLYDAGNGELKVWCVSFTIKGALPRKDGKVDETAVLKKQKQIEKLIEQLNLPEE